MMTIDVEIIKSAKLGDKDGFSQVYEQIAGDLYKFALYSVGNTHDAEDIVSETFIEAYKGIKNLRDENSFKAWMFRIVAARCKRKIGIIIKRKNEFDIEDFIGISDDTLVDVNTTERVMLLEALEKLTASERQIVVLSVLEGYTTKEIAEILSLPHGTVSSKLHRTLAKLRANCT